MITKTFWIFIFLNLILFSNTNAQDFKFGILSGFNVANAQLTNKPDIEGVSRIYYPLISITTNGYFSYLSSGVWGLSAEPGFIQKGGKIQNQQDNRDDDIKFKLNYIQLPILADFYLSDKIFLSVGPEFAYLINAKIKTKDFANDITDNYDNHFEISGLIGVNYNILENFDIGLRYNHGLTYTWKVTYTDDAGYEMGEMKEYNQYFQFIVRFKI